MAASPGTEGPGGYWVWAAERYNRFVSVGLVQKTRVWSPAVVPVLLPALVLRAGGCSQTGNGGMMVLAFETCVDCI